MTAIPPTRKAVIQIASLAGEYSRALKAFDKNKDGVKHVDSLLEKFYNHRMDWVPPYEGRDSGTSPDQPTFKPTWWNFQADTSDDLTLVFGRAGTGTGGYETVYVPVAYFEDPTGWIERDTARRVSVNEWYLAKDGATATWKDDQWEKVADQLRKQGYKVEKEETP